MKILFTCHYNFNTNAGAAGVTWRLGQEYERLGHEVDYYSYDSLPQRLHPLAKVALFPEFVAWRIAALERQTGVDIVDASTGDGWLWASFNRKRQHRPLIIARCHGLEHIEHEEYVEEVQRGNLQFSWKYPLYRGSIRLWEAAASLRYADLALLLNQRDRDYTIDNLGVSPDHAHVVANGIPETFLNQPFECLQANEPIRIAQISTYIIRKGVHYGSPALNAILQRFPEVEVSFLGTECSADIVYADFDPAVRDRIKVVPRYDHNTLPSLLKGHHIKLLPTIAEGFGVAIIEAMACGLAPITTATPGPLEIVRDGQNGIVVPCRDSAAIKQALEQLLTQRSCLERLRRNAYETAQTYSWSCIARHNLFLYDQARQLRGSSYDCLQPAAGE
ncbi:glycosyltransferase family 4 protein [Leptothermofonsia sichuanensis E412]|uniref:glycosyltransferase family 4 protein n=1 Tax=Leptothermofonsia sichuanensis TaxID=2917832 RepID=UPI001CA69E64|nr:glycosyltransferase family 4 protein [Leptothermofonsia sichuanensis]QZZ20061.1 glycosyltransferase family 4 protein [Leptothermofonsia sichuanensis E412]